MWNSLPAISLDRKQKKKKASKALNWVGTYGAKIGRHIDTKPISFRKKDSSILYRVLSYLDRNGRRILKVSVDRLLQIEIIGLLDSPEHFS